VDEYGITFPLQALIFNDTGSSCPNQLIYSSPTTAAGAATVTVAVNPEISLPSGNYWIGFAGEGFGAVSGDGTSAGSVYYAYLNGATSINLASFSTFPSLSNTNDTVGYMSIASGGG
jgi:hypothetical protein